MKIEGEVKAFMEVWVLAVASLTYCYFISFNVPPGKLRLLSLFPVFCTFVVLPLNISLVSLGFITAFFLTWLANFKLLLFSFDQGPLSTNPSISLPHFISIACLPIMIKGDTSISKLEKFLNLENKQPPSPQIPSKPSESPVYIATKALFLVLLSLVNEHTQHFHPKILLVYYWCYLSTFIELILAMVATLARALLGFELEPQFNKPHLSTSPQNFWGQRWNLMVSKTLKLTVHLPVKFISVKMMGKKWASLPAILSAFLVSGLMHEAIYSMYMGSPSPKWVITVSFVFQGILVDIEIAAKKIFKVKWRLHRALSIPITLGVLLLTQQWFFLPMLESCNADFSLITELIAMLDYFKTVGKSAVGLSFFYETIEQVHS